MSNATSIPPHRVNPRLNPRWVEARFDRIAWCYPLFEMLFLVPTRARQRAIERLNLREGQCVLSIGCGRGPMLPEIGKAVGEHGHVVGIDLSRQMLKTAEKQVRIRGLKNIELVRTNALHFTSANPFDSILFAFSLTSFGSPKSILDRAWKMLAPGGRLVILDAQLPESMRRPMRRGMPALRWFMESTVLGDPDMRAVPAIEGLGQPVNVSLMRGGIYFIAQVIKPI